MEGLIAVKNILSPLGVYPVCKYLLAVYRLIELFYSVVASLAYTVSNGRMISDQ